MSSRNPAQLMSAPETQTATPRSPTQANPTTTRAETAATNLCKGFIAHDRREGQACMDAFGAVDREQFPHLTDAEADRAGAAYAASLWAKDEVERPYVEGDRVVDPEGLAEADWSPVQEWLECRADIVGMDPAYAEKTTTAWKHHKVGGDYWTPTMAAQRLELRAAVGSTQYPEKPRFGADGFGHLATQYLTGVELHDMRTDHHWAQAVDVMTDYFADLFSRQEADR